MSQLKMHEKKVFEKLFNRDGYVLDFNDRTFAEFFREHGIDIEEEKYHFNGRSKMNRLRAFWEIESDNIVGKVLQSLLDCACIVEEVNSVDKEIAINIINKLKGKNQEQDIERVRDNDFLKQEFTNIQLQELKLGSVITEVLQQRIDEIEKCLKSKSALATIFLCGSTLEGILLGVATKKPYLFNSANTSPKDINGKVLKFQDWNLKNFIDVAKEVEFLNEDVKKFSHSLRDFRNYIHPYEQVKQNCNPDEQTAKICFQVLKAAIHQLTKRQK